MNIESSTWLLIPGETVTFRKWIEHHVHMAMTKLCLNASDFRTFTQPTYRDLMLCKNDRTAICPASWIHEEDIIGSSTLEDRLTARKGPLKVIFPARLVHDKGVDIVLDAVEILASRQIAVEVDIIGKGDMRDDCLDAAARLPAGPTKLRVLDPVPYGAPFFDLIGGYDIGLVTNRQAEQARIIFDIFSQGLALIATRTSGTQTIVAEGRDSVLIPINAPEALADAIASLTTDRDALATMRRAALEGVRGNTHEHMHSSLTRLLLERYLPWRVARGLD
jgi:glycosyltransferase involved in cell wall biosynthesis